ncbi:hypothetical protein [Aminobacter sp. HY435]|uniref:hypothetical protein n=1 Tax=Aminobacter sp. HY435 TaxID=2970917 RepID=UPI0022B9B35E|nr:hypothetical protein [Aminobacter sp. HY435]
MRFPAEVIDAVDEYRRDKLHQASRQDAIRELLHEHLVTNGYLRPRQNVGSKL